MVLLPQSYLWHYDSQKEESKLQHKIAVKSSDKVIGHNPDTSSQFLKPSCWRWFQDIHYSEDEESQRYVSKVWLYEEHGQQIACCLINNYRFWIFAVKVPFSKIGRPDA